jgi:hypothetical protein
MDTPTYKHDISALRMRDIGEIYGNFCSEHLCCNMTTTQHTGSVQKAVSSNICYTIYIRFLSSEMSTGALPDSRLPDISKTLLQSTNIGQVMHRYRENTMPTHASTCAHTHERARVQTKHSSAYSKVVSSQR